jgi:hypothetical protein
MNPAASPSAQPTTFRVWLRRELLRELRLSAVFLVVGCACVATADRLSTDFAGRWARLNYQLTYTALEQHPTALLDSFADRLSNTQYGWGLFSWSEPFNVTAARERLRADFPEFIGLDANGQPIPVRSSALRRAPAATQQSRAAAYLARHHEIESRRFTRLYSDESPFDVPSPSVRLGRLVTKTLGVPDALLHIVRRLVASGTASILLFSGSLALAAVALWSSHRPARLWLKILACPLLASALGWAVILLMSIAAAFFGGITPNTSALAVFAGAPLLYLAARTPLRLLEEMQFKPKPWDGVERRRAPRPPASATSGTVPPLGGA